MIIKFSLKNILSFKEKAVLDMRAIPAYKEHRYNLANLGSDEKLLRVAAIYGANASGKTNYYYGMKMFQKIVLNSMNAVDQIDDNVLEGEYNPFAFEETQDNSEFEVVFCSDNAEYTYGFEYNAQMVVSEWYYRKDFATNRTSVIIERNENVIRMGNSIRGECGKYKEQISQDVLALTFFSRLKLETQVFQEMIDEVRGMMIVDTGFFENSRIIERLLPNVIDDSKIKLLRFLSAIDTGIRDISYETVDKRIDFFTSHRGKDGKDYSINLYNESQGTIKSIVIFICISSVLSRNGVLVVDELNVKLHPLMLKFIIDLFYTEDSKAQLIYTTHDTTLMNKKFFRRDQIWFVDKDENGYSVLTALSDYKVRSDASFEKDYLSGVYGGIPMLKEFFMKEGK